MSPTRRPVPKEHFRGCVVVPLTHPDKGLVGLYGRRIRPDAKSRHLYLSGPHQGVLNWQALKASGSVLVTESILDAFSFWQAVSFSSSARRVVPHRPPSIWPAR